MMIRPFTVACALTLLLLAVACGERPQAPESEGAPSRGGTVVVMATEDLGPMNALVSSGRYGQEMLRYALALPLVAWSADLGYEPALARRWELIGDTAAIFELRDDVRWHDGARTTAYDVEFTFARAMGPESTYPGAGDFAAWTGVEALDSFRARARFTPHADPLAGVPLLPVMPKHLLDTVPPERMPQAAYNRAPVGNGPFRFVEYRAGDRWVLEANPDFPQALGGRPYLDRLVWRVVPDEAVQLTELRTGNAQLALNVRADVHAGLAADGRLRALTRESRQYAFIGWNGRRGALGDARVRRALMMALDRQRMIDALRAGQGHVAAGPVGRYHWSWDGRLEPLPFDTAAARALLAEAGIRDTDGDGALETADGRAFAIRLLVPAGSSLNRDLAELIRSDLASIGLRLEVDAREPGTIYGTVMAPDRAFDAVLLAWESDFRLSLRSLFHSAALDGKYQIAGYRNAVVDSLIDRTETTPDRDAARPLLHRLQRILRDEQPWGFLYYYPDLYAARPELRGADMDLRGALVNLPRWWLAAATPTAAR